MKKNNYLMEELAALKEYLTNIKENFYTPEVEICINVIANTNVPNETFDYLKEYIEGPER